MSKIRNVWRTFKYGGMRNNEDRPADIVQNRKEHTEELRRSQQEGGSDCSNVLHRMSKRDQRQHKTKEYISAAPILTSP